jgi:hypothetical protein
MPAMRWGRALGVLAGAIVPLLAFAACGGSTARAPGAGGTTQDAAGGTMQDAAIDAGCVALPLPLDSGLQFVPPNAPASVCTLTQIEDLYADCWAPGWTKTGCDNFYGDPTNSPCIRCMITPSTAPSWGPVVRFGDNYAFANLGGCLAFLTGDAGDGTCAQTIQFLQQCYETSCSAGCPDDTSAEAGAAIVACHDQARSTTCSAFAPGATSCENDSQNNACVFADFQADFIGIGEIFCAADGG